MNMNEMIAIRDFLTSAMAEQGNYKYWENALVNSVQAAIDETFEQMTGFRA